MVRVRGNADFVRQAPVLTIWYGESPFPVPNATTTRIGSGKRGLPYGSLSNELFSGRTSFCRRKSATSTSDRRRPFAVPKPLSEVGPCAAIVPGQEPESRDAGMSRFGENGSHLEAEDAAEDHAGQVEGSGMSGKCRNRLIPGRADVAESHARAGCGCGGRATGGLTTGRHSATMCSVADKYLIMSGIMIYPIWFC